MRSPELLVVTNIPSPYRLHEFGSLRAALEARGCGLRVCFMAGTERDRNWRFDTADARFPHRLARGPTLYPAEDIPIHVKPGVWLDILRSNPAWLLLGGMWYQPAVIASIFAHRSRTRVLFWNETSASPRKGLSERARRLVLDRPEGFVVPGETALAWVRRFSAAPVLHLANFVDENLFRDRVDELRSDQANLRKKWGYRTDDIVFLWPARLHSRKGIIPFLDSIRGIRQTYRIVLAGDGPQRQAIEGYLAACRIDNVTLAGHQSQERLLELYAIADALLLPSAIEPFGFVAVEALWAGLPLIMSSVAGATPEVITAGNGWVVDPTSSQSMRDGFLDALGAGATGLAAMGRCSRQLAAQRFDSQRSASRFVERLLETFPP